LDTLIRGGVVVTCDAKGTIAQGDVLVHGREIVAVGRMDPRVVAAGGLVRVLDASGCAVIPGFVQAHVHLCQALMRGMADDLPLLAWLRERIWPLEAAHDERSLAASAELGLAETIRAGTTTILDMGTVHGHDAVMDACATSGVRAISGKAMMDAGDGVPKGLRESTAGSLRESERLCRTWSGKAQGRLGYAFAPRFVLSCTEALVRGAVERARAMGALLHTHAAEHRSEREAVRAALGANDVAVLRSWGLSGPRAVLAHGVQLTKAEATAIAEEGTGIVHFPSANLKLGSGIAAIAALDALGVRLALGADGAPCNNNLDPWMEMRHAALLSSVRSKVGALTAERVLRLATIDGARALGLDAITGSLERGKRADLAVVRLDGVHAQPAAARGSTETRGVFGRLVYACKSTDVDHVMVDGALLVHKGELVRVDGPEVAARAREQGDRLRQRAGL
jgi:5-methylthioadenosine/S-adenosylhomocysteine deaminase